MLKRIHDDAIHCTTHTHAVFLDKPRSRAFQLYQSISHCTDRN